MYDAKPAARSLSIILLMFSLAMVSAAAPNLLVAQDGATNQSAHLYFFTNPGCAPCRQVEPGIEALKREGYPVTTIYLNQQPELGRRFLVDRTPTVILVSNNQIAGRHAGIIDGVELKQWFAAVGVASGSVFQNRTGGTKVELAGNPPPERFASREAPAESFVRSATMLKGTRVPANQIEKLALDATVRLKVEDPQGISYATGTVIHGHNGEYLLMTCGHVFRESAGKGEITAEFGFADGEIKTAPGQLISYDAQARDIALVAIRTAQTLRPVSLAAKACPVERDQKIFSIGCDHGESPTIRHSQIKNRAAYDGSIKYDIYGRPVDGRSGGGLFNEQGELIGVCNAAAVEVDEGIYTALETLHWQIAQVNLEHLFDDDIRLAANDAVAMPVAGAAAKTHTMGGNGLARIESRPRNQLAAEMPETRIAPMTDNRMTRGQNPVAWGRPAAAPEPSDMEVIIIVRSKSTPAQTQAITVSHPTAELLDYLDSMQVSNVQPKEIDVAELREGVGNQGVGTRILPR